MGEHLKEISISGIAKELSVNSQSVFQDFAEVGYIFRNTENNTWELTKLGVSKGGVYKESQYGRYIAWPYNIKDEYQTWLKKQTTQEMITASTIGKSFNMSGERINSILSELGYIRKDPREQNKGWHVTELGRKLGGVEERYANTGISFVRWPANLLSNQIINASIRESQGDVSPQLMQTPKEGDQQVGFREKFKAEHRAKDGHMVRSKSEIIIDNWLYDAKIVHAYERKLPVEEDIYCDFYIPTQKVYLEYWGLEDVQYQTRKKEKLSIYSKNNLNLIELSEKDVMNLDDILPAKLLIHGIVTEN
ncbi:hypothetical protein DEALK_18750 [Dehalogenimonas alkenigignens]|uniref:Glycerol kinase n=1 Tax=Dehalogenimonas alkenigignens TaxID=1217799 RepID=A0A0W0GKH1_9CHLR|nr:hypothetical protein [Dehalogenimonas alkenigignens]KTB49027.1 hypothetical protein DEALK_18750 [Dehalogenimonas alkenigignens]